MRDAVEEDLGKALAVYANYCQMWRHVGALAPEGSAFEVTERSDMLLIRSRYAQRVPHMVLDPVVPPGDAPRWAGELVRDLTIDPVSVMVGIPPGEEHGGLIQALLAEGFVRAARPTVAMTMPSARPSGPADPSITLALDDGELAEARVLLSRIFGLPSAVFAYYTPPDVVRTYLLRQESVVVAAACLCPAVDTAGIYSVGVLPGVRGRGFARRLVRHAAGDAATLGYATVVLSCEEGLAPLYRRLGFTACWELYSYWLEAWWR